MIKETIFPLFFYLLMVLAEIVVFRNLSSVHLKSQQRFQEALRFGGKCAFFFSFFSGGRSWVPFSMYSCCSKYSVRIQKAGARQFGGGTSQHCLLVSRLNSTEIFSLTQPWLCQKPLITSLDFSNQITKQYSHYASRRVGPKHFATPGIQHILIGSRDLRDKQGLLPTRDWAAVDFRVAGYTGLCSVIPRIGESRSLHRIQALRLDRKVIFST